MQNMNVNNNNNNSNNATSVKLMFDGQMRRFPFQGTSFVSLYEQIVALLGLEKNADLVLKYTDEEGDLITISSDLELKSAIVGGELLRIVATRGSVSPVISATPLEFVPQSADPFKAFQHGCGGHAKWDKEQKKEFKKAHKEEFKSLMEDRKMWKKQMKHGHHGFHHPPPFGGPHGFPPGPPPPFGGPADAPPRFGPFGGHPRMGPHPHGPWGGPRHHHGHHGPHHPGHHEAFESKLIARFAKDVTIQDGTSIPAGTLFVKTWRLRNEGTAAWPADSVLRFVGKHSDNLSGPEFVPVANQLAPGEEVDVSVNLVAPAKPGRYTGYWRMCTAEGRKFGQRVWVSIVVPGNSSSSEGEKEADRYEALVDIVLANEQLRNFGVKRHRVFRLLSRCGGDTDKVTALLIEKVNKKLGKKDNMCR